MKHIPQLQLTDDEFDRLNDEASQANMGLYDYVLNRLVGRVPAGTRPPAEWPPAMETKDAAEMERPDADGGVAAPSRRRRG